MGVGGFVRISMLNMRFWLVVSSGIMHFMGGCYKRLFVRVRGAYPCEGQARVPIGCV